ncbi:MAG: GNAT family N-acetyltransferase [Actinomycetia bacterium]|nr:GNAT family N-acetyltransferase [Actinomycetes bacterium]
MAGTEIHPVTADRRGDLLELFGDSGAYSNCWCTWWILTGRQFDEARKQDRRHILLDLVDDGSEPGLLAYRDDEPVGWCAVGPRPRFARMMSERARVYKPLDQRPSWVINCFYIPRTERGHGLATDLLDAAIAFARDRGATLLEAYPIDRSAKDHNAASLFVGTLSMFESAGFAEAARHNDRPLVRLELG